MGIKGLKRLISENAPDSIKEGKLDAYFGRKIAIDASMFLYSFLVAIQSGEDVFGLTDANGETTSHLQGLFNRTIRLLECGIKPVYVFDGKPPQLKGGELQKRKSRKKEAQDQLEEAQQAGDQEAISKLVKRTVTVTPKHNEESKRLLELLGVPVVQAPSEAEAQCAALCRANKVWATGTEDMDALTHATPILLRNLTMSESRKIPINEIKLDDVLAGLEIDMKEFVDLCILLGCDYCGNIRGIGPKRAIELIKKYKTIENVLENIDKTKYIVPEEFPFDGARDLFYNPEITSPDEIELNWTPPNEEELIAYLVGEKNFNETRVRNALARIKKGKSKSAQGRLDTYFAPAPKSPQKKVIKKPAKLAPNGPKRKRDNDSATNRKKLKL